MKTQNMKEQTRDFFANVNSEGFLLFSGFSVYKQHDARIVIQCCGPYCCLMSATPARTLSILHIVFLQLLLI